MGLNINIELPDVGKIKDNCEDAIQKAVMDTKKAAPGKMADAVRGRYNIKKGDVTKRLMGTGKGNVSVDGVDVANIRLTYVGSRLAPSSDGMFNMTPKERPEGGRKYQVKASIIKGQKKAMASDAFVGSNGYGANIPFQRKGDSRLPLKALQTLSVPQMITNEEVGAAGVEAIEEKLQTRLDYRLGKAMEDL